MRAVETDSGPSEGHHRVAVSLRWHGQGLGCGDALVVDPAGTAPASDALFSFGLRGELPHTAIAAYSGSRFICRQLSAAYRGGGKRVRTADLLLAKQLLSQLSYAPFVSESLRLDFRRPPVSNGHCSEGGMGGMRVRGFQLPSVPRLFSIEAPSAHVVVAIRSLELR